MRKSLLIGGGDSDAVSRDPPHQCPRPELVVHPDGEGLLPQGKRASPLWKYSSRVFEIFACAIG